MRSRNIHGTTVIRSDVAGARIPHRRGLVNMAIAPYVHPEVARAYALNLLAAAMEAEDEREGRC